MRNPRCPPTEATLHEAALAHLSRYAASRAGLTRVLDRRCERWARAAGTEEAAAALPALAPGRARGGGAAGRRRRGGRRRLRRQPRPQPRAQPAAPAAPSPPISPPAAWPATRRAPPCPTTPRPNWRRPWRWRAAAGSARSATPDAAADPRRELGVLARAGFSRDIAARALHTDPDTAEALVARLRRG